VDSLGNTVPANSLGDREVANKLLTGATFTPVVRARTVVRLSPYLDYNTLRNVFRNSRDHHNAFKVGGTATVSVTPRAGQSLILGADGGHTIVSSNFLGNRDLNDAALFGQYDLRLAQPLKLVAGGRLDYHKATAGERELSFSPKLGLVADASEHLTFRASIGRGYRAPSAIEQFVNTVQFGFRVIPNPALKGEHAWAGEVGMTATRGRLWADASVFQSNYRGLIGPGPVPNTPGAYQFRNIDRARVRGFDGGVRMRLWRNLVDLQASYLYLDSKDIDLSNFAHRKVALVYRSRHTVTATGELLSGLVGLDVRFRSRPEEVLQYPNDPRASITVVDLRLGYRLLGTGLQLKVDNLFQAHYTNVQERIPGAPRSLSLTAYRGF
jgi:outer membrane receptor protein involved in Fe transport